MSGLKDELTRKPRVLVLDIETSPHVIDAWALRDVNAGLNQVREVSRVLCVATKWMDEKRVRVFSEWEHGHAEMIAHVWEMLDRADILVTYNGPAFDEKHLNREFLLAGLAPPAPWRSVDLLRVARARFRFASNKLDHVAQQLGLGSKLAHEGHALWSAVLAGDVKARARMVRYAGQDVKLTEALYLRLLPWISQHPHRGLWSGEERCCFACGSTDLNQHGFTRTALTVYALLKCADCGAWSRANFRKHNVTTRGVK
jgi:hypothetical protein